MDANVIEFSHRFEVLLKNASCASCCANCLLEYCPDHAQRKRNLFCKQCGVEICANCLSTTHRGHEYTKSADAIDDETWRLEEAGDGVVELLEDVKRTVSGVQEVKRRVRSKKDNDVDVTRQIFSTLRKAIDEREEQAVVDIRAEAAKREKNLELQLHRLLYICTQLKKCLDLIKKTIAGNLRAEELVNRRRILEEWSDNLVKMRSKINPVRCIQRELKFQNVDNLCQEVNKLGFVPVDPSKCEVNIPAMIVKETATIMITLRDKNGDPVSDDGEDICVHVKNARGDEAVQVRPIKEVGRGIYEASFTVTKCGYYMISIIVDDRHTPGSPYRIPVDRDYSKITEQDCSQMVTHYEGIEFGRLNDIAIGPNGEVVMVDYSNRCVVVLDNKLNLLKVIDQDSSDDLLANPNGVAVSDNIIAVSDYGSHQVKNYSWQGEFLSVIGCYGRNNGQFKYPRGLAFSDDKILYVVDGENFRIQAFQQDMFSFSFSSKESGPGQFQCPVRIAIDPARHNVLVTDISANCIHVFSGNGQFIQAIDCHDPWAIAVSPTGYLITGHYGGDHKIITWSPMYQLIKRFGKKGSKQGEFCGVIGMAMDTHGAIYIVEYFNKRLQVIL